MPHFSSDASATSTPITSLHLELKQERWGVVLGRPLILGDPEAPSPPPIWKQKLIKGKKNPYRKKKKKEGKKEKITLCFLLKSTKCNIYRYHTDLGPGRGESGPVKHREEGRRGQFRAGEGASGPHPQPSLNPAYDYQKGGGCSQTYPSPNPMRSRTTPS